MHYRPDLARLLIEGARYVDDTTTYVLRRQPLEAVHLPTGQVVGCDPLVFADSQPPFTVTVEPGTYSLVAWVAVMYQEDAEWQRRTAALQLVIRDEPAVRWELALIEDQDVAELWNDEYFGYGVDAGAGTLADLVAVRALASWEVDRVDSVYVPAELPPAPAAMNAVTDEPTGANVVVVTTGWGDGHYPTFIGYTAAGAVGTFVTDFMVVPQDDKP